MQVEVEKKSQLICQLEGEINQLKIDIRSEKDHLTMMKNRFELDRVAMDTETKLANERSNINPN